jgi:hypothetical protein
MSADPSPSTEDATAFAVATKLSPVATLAKWISELGKDADALLGVCEQLAPGAALRAPLRAGLRHLVHIYPLASGIEGLAMLEVSLVLRVTALLAQPAEELGDETVLRLRAETGLIEELFPSEREALWLLSSRLIERERALDVPSTDQSELTQEVEDPLFQRVRAWSQGYVAPEFGGHAQELTRARAFVKNRAHAWSA